MNNLSVIIPSKSRTNLIPCLSAVKKCEPGAWRLVIDDGANLPPRGGGTLDGLYEMIVPGVKPFIYARNCNIGIRTAGEDDVILLNDDALLQTPGGLIAMQRAAAEHPEYGIIGAVTNIVGNQNQLPQEIGLREDPRMVCFVCVFIPRRTIERVGLLDEEFTGYGFEDDSYCLRVRRAGLKIGIYDGCFVDHGSLRSTFRGDPRTPANLTHNAAIFRNKYGADNWAL